MEKVVILDPGHGGIDPMTKQYVTSGKRSPEWHDMDVYYEGEGNRKIVKLASQLLRPLGWNVLYTVHPDDSRDIPLNIRQQKSNEYYKNHPTAFQISVHSNGFSKESANGHETLVLNKQTKSYPMALIHNEEHAKLFPDLTNRGVKTMNLAMNRVNCPSILIESMFHTNYEECKILHSREGKEKIAIAISETCERIYNEIINK